MNVTFERGEDILTEISCKFTREGLTREYAAAGLDVVSWHTDARGRFALSLTAPR
jgi:L-histidine N-alpha-methyltransferase